jgi:D-xylose transport system substrate-binding protein
MAMRGEVGGARRAREVAPVLRAGASLLVLVLTLAGLAGCTLTDETRIAFLLASTNSVRWQEQDEPAFAARVEALCPGCVYESVNAEGDADTQARQFEAALEDGADVIVLNAVTAADGERLVAQAGTVPIVAYDRFVAGADYFVSYDAAAIGERMASAVVREIGGEGQVLVVNGAQTDPNGVVIKRAVHRVLADNEIEVLAESDPQSWSAAEARDWVRKQLDRTPLARVDAIVAANDAQAQGVAIALAERKVPVAQWPVISGQDADLEALQRIIQGQQTITVFKSFPREAQQAADIAATLVTGGTVEGAEDYEGVPSFIFDPVVVILNNIANTIVRDGVFDIATLCAPRLGTACSRAGLH